VVTLDAYGTVFDFESRIRLRAVSEILERAGAGEVSAPRFADQWGENFFALYAGSIREADADPGGFRTIADITAEALAVTYRQNGLELDPWPGTELWIDWLGRVSPYPEVRAVLAELAARFRVAVVSDIDDRIIAPALERLDWDFALVLTSEAARAYKSDPGGLIFRRALEELGSAPEETVHVGDSPADVFGARRSGLRAAWVNRHGRQLPPGCPAPDWEIADLSELPAILGAREAGG
jgi:2-haloalkanoic acid dehalogenase type II